MKKSSFYKSSNQGLLIYLNIYVKTSVILFGVKEK